MKVIRSSQALFKLSELDSVSRYINVLGVLVVIITLKYLFKLNGLLPSSMEYDADYTKI